jgi:hypothetical protein
MMVHIYMILDTRMAPFVLLCTLYATSRTNITGFQCWIFILFYRLLDYVEILDSDLCWIFGSKGQLTTGIIKCMHT